MPWVAFVRQGQPFAVKNSAGAEILVSLCASCGEEKARAVCKHARQQRLTTIP